MLSAKTSNEDLIRQLPCWGGALDIAPLHGGLSNESHLVRDQNGQYVVRFGQDYPFHHVNREREIMTARAAAAAGFAPKVHYSAPGVMVSAFIGGRTLTGDDVRANRIRIAELIAAFHHEMPKGVSGSASLFWVFHVIRDYVRTLSVASGFWSERLSGYLVLADELEAAQISLPIIFGHHDLLPANFIDDGTKIWLIDFEYAGFSTAMFDIAGVTANAEMNELEAVETLAAYFRAASGDRPEDVCDVAGRRRSFLAMQCAALLREAMWAMVSQVHLKTPGVNFESYATENLARLDRAVETYRKAFP